MAVPAPPMSRATSSQHPATTASATADGAVAGGTPCQATMMRLPPAGHADLLVAMLTGALRAVAGGGHMHYHVRGLRPTDGLGVLLRRHPALCGPKYPCMATHQRAVPCPTTATVRAEFRHVRDAFHDATRAAVCEASEKARAAGGVRRVRRRTAQEMKESETCRQ
eukprot:jgi/Tetstr1/422973/TSEL_013751.t1